MAHPNVEQAVAFGIGAVLQLTQQSRMISRAHFGITKLAYVPASTVPPSWAAIICMP